MPWVILHYVTKWRQAPKITNEDEKLLDELNALMDKHGSRRPIWRCGLGAGW